MLRHPLYIFSRFRPLAFAEPWVSFKLSSVFLAPRSGALLPFHIATRVPTVILYDNYVIYIHILFL